MKAPWQNIVAIAVHCAFAVGLTGCGGILDGFNPKRVPVEVTESAQSADDNDASNPEGSSATTVGSTNTAPRATRTSAAGDYEGDSEATPRNPTSHQPLSHQASPQQQSGQRIRTKVLISDDGDRAFLGWYDSERHEDCDFVRDAEGTTRCLPVGTDSGLWDAAELSQFVAADPAIIAGPSRVKGYGWVTQDGAISISGFYDENTDLGCLWTGDADVVHCMPQAQRISHYVDQAHTRLLIQGDPNSTSVTPNIGEHYHSSSCTSDYYRAGVPFQGDRVFPRGSQDARPIAQGESFFELGEPIAGTSFASAVVTADATDSGRLTALYWVAADGGVWFSHWYDNELETACVFTQDPEPRCVPKADGVRIYYADTDCSDPVAEIFPKHDCHDEVSPPRYVTALDSDGDGASVSAVYAVSRERTLTTRYQKTSAGACQPQVAAARAHYFSLDTPIPASELAGGQVVIE